MSASCVRWGLQDVFPLVTLCREIMDGVPYHWEVVGATVTICDFCFFRYFFSLLN